MVNIFSICKATLVAASHQNANLTLMPKRSIRWNGEPLRASPFEFVVGPPLTELPQFPSPCWVQALDQCFDNIGETLGGANRWGNRTGTPRATQRPISWLPEWARRRPCWEPPLAQ